MLGQGEEMQMRLSLRPSVHSGKFFILRVTAPDFGEQAVVRKVTEKRVQIHDVMYA